MACLLWLVWWKHQSSFYPCLWNSPSGIILKKNRIHMHPYENCLPFKCFRSWFRDSGTFFHLKKSWKSLILHNDEWEKMLDSKVLQQQKHKWTKSQKKKAFLCFHRIYCLMQSLDVTRFVVWFSKFLKGASSGGTIATTTTAERTACFDWIFL